MRLTGDQAKMPTVVAVAGGTRGMGLAIVHELKKFPDLYKVKILSRQNNTVLSDELGVQVVAVDYLDVDSITAVWRRKKSTLFSPMSSYQTGSCLPSIT